MHFYYSLVFLISFGLKACKSYSLRQEFWTHKGHPIGYEIAYKSSSDSKLNIPSSPHDDPVLLLNGFGVGSFHQHRLIPELLVPSSVSSSINGKNLNSLNRIVYGIDYLGQGRSWPIACEDGEAECEKGLIYSADTWADQIISFIEEIVVPNHKTNNENKNEPVKVHLVGNSVGGYLSVIVALRRPDLVSTISLLNATPVWGLNLPGWSGHLPAPFIPKKIGRYLFDRIRDLNTIEAYLSAAYAKRSAFDDNLMKQIRACTEGPGGHAAFASILWSPPASLPNTPNTDFNTKLSKLKCDVLLLFGRDDPWCKPIFAKKMLSSLQGRPGCTERYIEVSDAGHCPNHEAPHAVAHALNQWIPAKDRSRDHLSLVEGNDFMIKEPWGDFRLREVGLEEANDLSIFDKLTIKMVG